MGLRRQEMALSSCVRRTRGPAGIPGTAPSGFDPLSLSPALWLKADAGLYQERTGASATTLAAADADPAGSWLDQSGNARHLVAAADSNRPALKLAIQNSLPVVRFDGVDDLLASAAFGAAIAQPLTMVLVFKATTADVNNPYVFDGGGADQMLMHRTGGNWNIYAGGTNRSLGADDSNFHTLLIEWANAGTPLYRFDGGAETTIATPGANSLSALTLMGRFGGTQACAGDVGEFLVLSGLLSAANKTNLFAYLQSRWATY